MNEDKKEYKYTNEEKEKFMLVYNSFMNELMLKFNELNNNISQVSVSGSGNIRLMDSSFRIIVENFKNFDVISNMFNKVNNNEYSKELIEDIFTKFNDNGET